MKAPGFSNSKNRNSETWFTFDLSKVSSDADKHNRPCVMPMRWYKNHHLLSGVVYLDFDKKEWSPMKRKDVISILRGHPDIQWVGKSAGDGVIAIAWDGSLAGRAIENAGDDYLHSWDEFAHDIQSRSGLVADRGARGVNRVVYLPQDKITWELPEIVPLTPVVQNGLRKGLLGRGSSPPSEVDQAVAAEPDRAWALLGLHQGANTCPLTGCAHSTPEGHLSVGGGRKPWMAVHYDSDGEKGYSYESLWKLLMEPEESGDNILGYFDWVVDETPELWDMLTRWSTVDRNAPLPDLDMGPLGKDPAAMNAGFISSQHLTWLYGHRGTGKTWIALWLASSHVQRNAGVILWVSAEMSNERMVSRLHEIGQGSSASSFYSLEPRLIEAADLESVGELADFLAARNGFVILDSAGSLRAGTDDDSFQRWAERYLNQFILSGVGVMVLDHIRKKAQLEDGEIAGPIGTVQKQNRADAMLELRGRMADRFDVVLRKKRDLLYDDAEEGDVIRIITPFEDSIGLTFEVSQPRTAPSGQRLSTREGTILDVVATEWLTTNEVSDLIKYTGSPEPLRMDLQGLVREGMLEVQKEGRENRFRKPPRKLPTKEATC